MTDFVFLGGGGGGGVLSYAPKPTQFKDFSFLDIFKILAYLMTILVQLVVYSTISLISSTLNIKV